MMPSSGIQGKPSGSALWKRLYGMIWLNVIVIILVPDFGLPIPSLVHAISGFAVLGLAYLNSMELVKTACPDRLKRISKSTLSLAVLESVLGLLLYVNIWAQQTFCTINLISLMHVVTALAIITQATSVATGYDMWEEKEFEPKKAEANPKPS